LGRPSTGTSPGFKQDAGAKKKKKKKKLAGKTRLETKKRKATSKIHDDAPH